MMDKDFMQEVIAKRVAQEFHHNDAITLGIGLPTKAVNYLPKDVKVMVQSENGVLGVTACKPEERDERIINAGGMEVGINEGGCFIDSFSAFGMMRGGHI